MNERRERSQVKTEESEAHQSPVKKLEQHIVEMFKNGELLVGNNARSITFSLALAIGTGVGGYGLGVSSVEQGPKTGVERSDVVDQHGESTVEIYSSPTVEYAKQGDMYIVSLVFSLQINGKLVEERVNLGEVGDVNLELIESSLKTEESGTEGLGVYSFSGSVRVNPNETRIFQVNVLRNKDGGYGVFKTVTDSRSEGGEGGGVEGGGPNVNATTGTSVQEVK